MSPDRFADLRGSYDTVARRYAEEIGAELDHRPLERGLLAAFVEMTHGGVVADVGCGPGHVTRHLASLGCPVVGIDLSPAMIEIARAQNQGIAFEVGSMTELSAAPGSWAGALSFYSIIHLDKDDRAKTYRELARVVRPGGVVLVGFHVSDAQHRPGDVHHLEEWWGHRVSLDGYFLAPEEVAAGMAEAGLPTFARIDREPIPDKEYPSRRSYLFARRE